MLKNEGNCEERESGRDLRARKKSFFIIGEAKPAITGNISLHYFKFV